MIVQYQIGAFLREGFRKTPSHPVTATGSGDNGDFFF